MAATDERAIHEFPTGTIDDNSLLIMDRPTATPGEYETEKFAIANLGLKLLGGIDFPNNLDTDEQDIFGAINEVNAKAMNIAAEYDETASYSKGDYCIYQNATYRCIKDPGTTTGTFVAADWTQIKVLSEVKANTGVISELKSNTSANFDYTANETLIGDYFGIPLYRKYFEIGALPNNTTKTVDILDFTIRDVVDFRCIAKTTNNQSTVTLPYLSSQSAFNIICDIECTNNKTKVNITTQMDRTGMVAFGIIDYLKWSN